MGIAAALPDIATDLGNVSLLLWVITAYLLTSSFPAVGDVELVRELIASPQGGDPPGAAAAVRFGFAATVAVGFVLTP